MLMRSQIVFFSLLLLSLPLAAENYFKQNEIKTFASWTTTHQVFENSVLAFAKTTNKDGSTLGFLCSSITNECLPYISLKLGCETQKKYPMLISLPEGIYAELLLCEQLSGFYIYNLPSTYTNSLLEANQVGFAYGLATGEFKASYFSLDGSPKALIAAKKIIHSFNNNKPQEKPNPSTDEKKIYL